MTRADQAQPRDVLIEDEFLRDGLQSEAIALSDDEKVSLARRLADAGVARIQVGSFVDPARVPQMRGTDEVVERLGHRPGVIFSALALNLKGVERALACGVQHLSVSLSASAEHSLRNLNRSVEEARADIAVSIDRALAAGVPVRAGIQCAFGSPFEADIAPAFVADLARSLAGFGANEINLADTAGLANTRSVKEVVRIVKDAVPKGVALSLHLHNTRGLGIANMIAGWEAGVTIFDAALGGAGGCPFIPKAAGNVATEDAAFALEQTGVATGIDWRRLSLLTLEVESKLGRRLPGAVAHVEVEAG
jgi:hydroxymethylglutaryl-CoA lyase